MIYLGSAPARAIYAGTDPVRAIYAGTMKIWPPAGGEDPAPDYDFFDDFERSTIGPDWTGSGGVIHEGALRKNTVTGSTTYWTADQFAGDNLDVTATLGPVQDHQQKAAVLIGSPEEYVSVEFSQSAGQVVDYDGTRWTSLNNFGRRQWEAGDVIRVYRVGELIRVERNGELIATASSNLAMGEQHRRVGLAVYTDRVVIVNFYGPTFDDVGILAR